MEKFGDLLRRIRKEKNIRVKQLSDSSGITMAQIRNLETNKCKPNAVTVAKLSKALEYEFDY